MDQRSGRINMAEYIACQETEVLSPLNVFGTCQEFQTGKPTRNQLWLHYISCGRAQEIARIHSDLNIWGASEVLDIDVMQLPSELREAILFAVYDFWREIIITAASNGHHLV
jgi:hypothetical protein